MRTLLMTIAIVAAGCTDPVPLSGPHRVYQVTAEHVPTTKDEAKAYGSNDQLGLALAYVVDQGLGDPQGATDQAFMANQVQLAIDVQQPDSASKSVPAAVNTFAGLAPAFDPSSPAQEPLTGTANGSLVSAGPGDLAVVIAPFGMPLSITLHGATVELIAGPADLQAVVDGGVDQPTIQTVLIPAWAQVVAPIIARDCPEPHPPTCGCASRSPGGDALNVMDTNHDCMLTADELAAAPIVQSLSASDLTVDGKPVVSFAFSLDATYAKTVP